MTTLSTQEPQLRLRPADKRVLERGGAVRSFDRSKLRATAEFFRELSRAAEKPWRELDEESRHILRQIAAQDFPRPKGVGRLRWQIGFVFSIVLTAIDAVVRRPELVEVFAAAYELREAARRAVAKEAWADVHEDAEFMRSIESGEQQARDGHVASGMRVFREPNASANVAFPAKSAKETGCGNNGIVRRQRPVK